MASFGPSAGHSAALQGQIQEALTYNKPGCENKKSTKKMVKYLCAVHCSNLAMSLKTQLSNVKINTCVMHLPSKCPGAEGSIPTDRERHVHSYCTLFVYQAAKAQSAVQHCHCSIQITQLQKSCVRFSSLPKYSILPSEAHARTRLYLLLRTRQVMAKLESRVPRLRSSGNRFRHVHR